MFKSYETFSFLHTHIYTYIYLFNFTYRIPESQKTLNRDTLSNIPLHEHPHSSPRSYFSLNPWIQVDQNCIGPRFLWELREEGAAGRRQGNRIQSQITTVHRSSRPLGLMRSMRACVTVYLSTMEERGRAFSLPFPFRPSFFFSREISRVSFQIGESGRGWIIPPLICMPRLPQRYNHQAYQGHALACGLDGRGG